MKKAHPNKNCHIERKVQKRIVIKGEKTGSLCIWRQVMTAWNWHVRKVGLLLLAPCVRIKKDQRSPLPALPIYDLFSLNYLPMHASPSPFLVFSSCFSFFLSQAHAYIYIYTHSSYTFLSTPFLFNFCIICPSIQLTHSTIFLHGFNHPPKKLQPT